MILDIMWAAKQAAARQKAIRRSARGLYEKNLTPHIALLALAIALLCFTLCVVWQAASAESAEGERLYVAVEPGSALNGRADPSADSERCASFENGDALTVISYQDGWYEVQGSEYGTCWVSADYVSATAASQPWQATISSNGRVAQRDQPDGERVGWLHAGDAVTVYATADGWARTDSGWVSKKYLVAGEAQ